MQYRTTVQEQGKMVAQLKPIADEKDPRVQRMNDLEDHDPCLLTRRNIHIMRDIFWEDYQVTEACLKHMIQGLMEHPETW